MFDNWSLSAFEKSVSKRQFFESTTIDYHEFDIDYIHVYQLNKSNFVCGKDYTKQNLLPANHQTCLKLFENPLYKVF